MPDHNPSLTADLNRRLTLITRVTLTSLCLQLPTSAVNMALPACVAERRAADSRCGAAAAGRPGSRRCRSITPARTALSSKPAAHRCCGRMMGQTDGRTDARPFHRPRSAYYASSGNNLNPNRNNPTQRNSPKH